jgi:polysaccharide deacetylase family protein (PEP-CTERM system associated)
MSIDVEDWFHAENLNSAVPREGWNLHQLRVERNTQRMLELLEEHEARATFFVLGWVAERCPKLVQQIARAGHEIGCHGFNHELLPTLSRSQFRDDVVCAKSLLEDISGAQVRGYRAPSFSITNWAIDVLHELGFEYDSSFFPTIVHDRYGTLPFPARERVVEVRANFHEICISCLYLGSRPVPWGGGGYFRVLPYRVFRRGVAAILETGQPYVFYIHPWEIDAAQPVIPQVPRLKRFRHYVGLGSCERRLSSLLREVGWSAIADLRDWWIADRARVVDGERVRNERRDREGIPQR